VGQLKIDGSTGKPSLLIGHHLLEGTIASLPKPFAVIFRTIAGQNDAMGLDVPSTGPDLSSSWSVVGIVKKKIVFSKRPMPVMGKQLADLRS